MKLTKTAWVLHICTWRHLPLWNHDHLCHCSRLDLQTQEKAVETPNLQLDQQNIQFTSSPTLSQNVQSSPSAPPSFNWPCYRAYTHSKIWLSKRDCFFCLPENHFNVIIVWWETAYKMQLLQIKKKKSDSRLSTQSHWPRTILQASTSPPFWKEGDSILNY